MPKRKRKNKIPYLIVLVILVAVFVTMAIQARNKEDNEGGDTGNYTSVEQKDEEGGKKENGEEPKEELEDVIERKTVQYDGGSPNELDNLTGAINYAGINGDKLLIRVSIDQYLEEGNCELVLMQVGEVIYHSAAEIMGDATASTCKGFDVPVTALSNGEIQFTVYFNSGDKAGEVSGGIEL